MGVWASSHQNIFLRVLANLRESGNWKASEMLFFFSFVQVRFLWLWLKLGSTQKVTRLVKFGSSCSCSNSWHYFLFTFIRTVKNISEVSYKNEQKTLQTPTGRWALGNNVIVIFIKAYSFFTVLETVRQVCKVVLSHFVTIFMKINIWMSTRN